MRRIFLLTTLCLAFSIGCGNDKKAANVEFTEDGNTAKGGRTSKGGSGGKSSGGKSGAKGGADNGGADNGGADNGGADRGGTGGTSLNSGGSSKGGQGGATAVVNLPGAPVLSFLTPPSNQDPNSANVIVAESINATLDVQCKATAATEPAGSTVDVSTTKLSMSQAKDTLSPTVRSLANGVLTSTFDLTSIPSGTLEFRCEAEDLSNPPLTGAAVRSVLVDRGPVINIETPNTTSIIGVNKGADINFTIEAPPLADGDTKSNVVDVTVTLGGKEVFVTEPTNLVGQFLGHVNLKDLALFPVSTNPYEISTLKVIAKNARGAISVEPRAFKVDASPPKITIQTLPSTAVGNNVTLKFTVVDAGAGIDLDTVKVTLGSSAFTFNAMETGQWSHPNATDFEFTFNAADVIGTSAAQVSIFVSAADKVGNANDDGASIVLFLDQVPPIISLDPPSVRERQITTAACSNAFDPVGPRAVNDLDPIDSVPFFRALVWDDTNFVKEGIIQYFARTDQNKVWLVLRNEVGKAPLLVNNDKDAACDDLAVSSGLPAFQLKKIDPIGISPWVKSDSDTLFYSEDVKDANPGDTSDVNPLLLDGHCTRTGWSLGTTAFLCNGESDMTRVIQHEVEGSTPEPVIYAVTPTGSPSSGCTGTYWEIGSLIKGSTPAAREGWHCAAVKAVDNVGNVGVSRPIRLCYDDPKTTTYKPDCSAATAPKLEDCTDGCTLPNAMIDRFIDIR